MLPPFLGQALGCFQDRSHSDIRCSFHSCASQDSWDDERTAEAEIVLAPIGDVAVEKLQLTDNAHQTLQLAWTLLFNHECTLAKGSVAAALIDEGT